MVGIKELAAGDPVTLKASVVHCPPASKSVPVGPATVKVSKSSRMKQMSEMGAMDLKAQLYFQVATS